MDHLEPRLMLSGIFAASVDCPTGSWPDSVISTDFNGDGHADLAVANASANTVSILLGNGDGTLDAKVDYVTGSGPQSLTSGDFNKDGNADLAVANGADNTVRILLGNGDGTFIVGVQYATGRSPYCVISADFNGDGKADLATANIHDNTLSILLGNGDGAFAAKADYATGAGLYSLTSADFNGDGKADLVAANYTDSTVSILAGNGDGGFAAKTDYATGKYPLSVVSADFNGDGKADLDVANASADTVSILLGSGGAFTAKSDYATGAGPYSVISADFNVDGKADLAVTNYNDNTVRILLGNGSGFFTVDGDYATGRYPISASSADFNGDGKTDLAVANISDNTVSVLLRTAVDVTPPTSHVLALPASMNSTTFTVTWSDSGDAGASGSVIFDVFVSDNGSGFTAWKAATTDTSAAYTAQPEHTYQFYSIATDNAGNRESVPDQPDATISIWSTQSKTLQGKDNKWTFTDFDGTPVTIAYTGIGRAKIERWINPTSLAHAGDVRIVTIDGSNAKSALTITTKGKAIAAQTSVEGITVHGSLKSITGKTTSLLGNVTVDGTLGSLKMDEATVGSTISIGPRPAGDTKTTTSLTFDLVAEMSIQSATPVRSLVVTQWLDNDAAPDVISAPYMATLNATGDKKRSLPGDFEADLNLRSQDVTGVSLRSFKAFGSVTGAAWTLAGGAGTITVNASDSSWTANFGEAGHWARVKKIVSVSGDLAGSFTANSIGTVSASANLANLVLNLKQAPDAKLKALSTLSAKGWIDSSQIRTDGTIQRVTARGIRNSTIFAGVDVVRNEQGLGALPDDVLALPDTGDLAVSPVGGLLAAINAFTITGVRVGKTYVPSFIDSKIAAGSLGKIKLSYVSYDNDGNQSVHELPFGLTTATTSAFGLSYRDADRTHAYKWTNGTNLPSWFDDFTLRLV